METASDWFEDVASYYTRIVRQVSREAATTIDLINAVFGSQAALRAALIITALKMEVQQNRWIPGIDAYDVLLEDFPDALPLTKYALRCCLQVWGIGDSLPVHVKTSSRTNEDAEAHSKTAS